MIATTHSVALGDLAPHAGTFQSDWITVTQERIALFAEATEDRQWIHVDAERAEPAKDGVKVTWHVVVEDETRPVLVAEWIVMYYAETR